MGALVGLLVMVANTAVSRADDGSPTPPREATLLYGPEPHQVFDLHPPRASTGVAPEL